MNSDAFEELTRVVAQLRDPENGCPWDLEQTHVTLQKYLEEETAEVLEAIQTLENEDKNPDYEALAEELGDVLLQVMLHAQIASESGNFDINDVLRILIDKLIRRHPHVFGNSDASSVDEVVAQWERIKAEEKAKKEKI